MNVGSLGKESHYGEDVLLYLVVKTQRSVYRVKFLELIHVVC